MSKSFDNIFVRVRLFERIKLEPAFISKGFKDEVLTRLKAKVEGICTKHGYIRPNSIEIVKISTGRVELIGLNGNTQFDVYFTADVCNPLIGSVIKCQVSNINKFGILAEAGNIIEAIIAKNSVSIQSDVDLQKIRIGDEVLIEVLGKKYELNDKKISLIARIVRNQETPRSYSSSYKRQTHTEDEDEEHNLRFIEGGADDDNVETDATDASDASDESDESDESDNAEEDSDSNEDENDDGGNETGDEEDDVSSDKAGNFFSDDDDYFKSDFEEDYDVENDSDDSNITDDE